MSLTASPIVPKKDGLR